MAWILFFMCLWPCCNFDYVWSAQVTCVLHAVCMCVWVCVCVCVCVCVSVACCVCLSPGALKVPLVWEVFQHLYILLMKQPLTTITTVSAIAWHAHTHTHSMQHTCYLCRPNIIKIAAGSQTHEEQYSSHVQPMVYLAPTNNATTRLTMAALNVEHWPKPLYN